MPSKFARKTLAETPLEIREQVIKYGYDMKTINQFIKELQAISEDKRELPLIIACPNGETTYPSVKMFYSNKIDILSVPPDKMIITWE